MGSHDCEFAFKAKTRAEAEVIAQEHQRQQQYENGHGAYTGHLGTAGIGVQYDPTVFADENAARNWILDRHDKWDVPYLVKYGTDDDWLLAGWCSS